MARFPPLLFVVLAIVTSACSADKVTEIVVSVATDIQTPPEPPIDDPVALDEWLKHGEVRVVRFKVERHLQQGADGEPHGEVVTDILWDLRPASGEEQIVLPATIGLLPAAGRDLDDPILITVSTDVYFLDQILTDKVISYPLERRARLAFVKDSIIHLRMNLLAKCVHLDCPAGYTCGDDGSCEPVEIDDPPAFDPDAAFTPLPDSGGFREAGIDAKPEEDGGAGDLAGDLPLADGTVDAGVPTPDSTVDTVSADMTVDLISPDVSVDGGAPPADMSVDSISADVTVDGGGPVVDSTVDTLGADSSIDALSVDTSVDTLSPDSSVDTLSSDTSVDTLSPDSSVDTLGVDTSVDTLSPDTSVDTLSPDSSVDTLPPDSSLDSSVDAPLSDSLNLDSSVDVLNDMAISANCSPEGWCTIPAGTFMMGSPPAELCRPPNPVFPGDPDDEILHPVRLTRTFEIWHTEVTEDEFEAVTGYQPSSDNCKRQETCPVEFVNWYEAVAYCNALSPAAEQCFDCTGFGTPDVTCLLKGAYLADIYSCPGYRLPTDAEWEYAARAGSLTALPGGDIASVANCDTNLDPVVDQVAWYASNCTSKQEVALKAPNAWGLYDMHGNVWEWVYDPYQEDLGTSLVEDPVGVAVIAATKVQRGGTYSAAARYARSAHRQGRGDANRAPFYGFRCARTRPQM